ncbi:unnamed protein product [Diabrotica balteata]|uniref:Uncharacterized protein n=1 Tax=Diabrotica balteata TaxID=107213 RepID=A0A9N9T7G6_DIABA|nr:unnamed protein product [Diabrotica balteata]
MNFDQKKLNTKTATIFKEDVQGNTFHFNDICEIYGKKVLVLKTLLKLHLHKRSTDQLIPQKKNKKGLESMDIIELENAYNGSLPITEKKKKVLTSLCEDKSVPPIHADFF